MATLRDLQKAINAVPEEYMDLTVVQWDGGSFSEQFVVSEIRVNLNDGAYAWDGKVQNFVKLAEFVEFR
jgi:hypothetical protein